MESNNILESWICRSLCHCHCHCTVGLLRATDFASITATAATATTGTNATANATTTATTTATTDCSMNRRTVCHELPCRIAYSGAAPVAAYFHPTPIISIPPPLSPQPPPPLDPPQWQAATVRGRGLIARANPLSFAEYRANAADGTTGMATVTTTPPPPPSTGMGMGMGIQGCVFQQQQPKNTTLSSSFSSSSTVVLQRIEAFDAVTEWQHEHSIHSNNSIHSNTSTTASQQSRWNQALDWIAVAAALHEPLPQPIPSSSSQK